MVSSPDKKKKRQAQHQDELADNRNRLINELDLKLSFYRENELEGEHVQRIK